MAAVDALDTYTRAGRDGLSFERVVHILRCRGQWIRGHGIVRARRSTASFVKPSTNSASYHSTTPEATRRPFPDSDGHARTHARTTPPSSSLEGPRTPQELPFPTPWVVRGRRTGSLTGRAIRVHLGCCGLPSRARAISPSGRGRCSGSPFADEWISFLRRRGMRAQQRGGESAGRGSRQRPAW